MDIVYSASDLYAPLAGISLTSLLENNKDVDSIHVIIMDNGISKVNKKKLIKTVEKFGRDIQFVLLTELLKNIKINVQKWNISTFGRLFEASSLPQSEKVIHIDCDTVVCGSLKELWNLDMNCCTVAGVTDALSDLYKKNIGLKSDDKYFNAGILVMNLKRIRELNYESDFLQYIKKNNKFLAYVDQEVLNACIPSSEKKKLPLKFNSYSIINYLSYEQLKVLRHIKNIFSEDEFNEAVSNPVILHYTGCFLEGTRPWIMGDRHPRKELFEYYKSISEWNNMEDWNDERNLGRKMITYIANLMPMPLLTNVIGIIHGIIIPEINKLKRNCLI